MSYFTDDFLIDVYATLSSNKDDGKLFKEINDYIDSLKLDPVTKEIIDVAMTQALANHVSSKHDASLGLPDPISTVHITGGLAIYRTYMQFAISNGYYPEESTKALNILLEIDSMIMRHLVSKERIVKVKKYVPFKIIDGGKDI